MRGRVRERAGVRGGAADGGVAASRHESHCHRHQCDGIDRCRHWNCRSILHRTAGGISRAGSPRRFREILVRYGRWLVAGLTFQLAADIIATSVVPGWQEVGQPGAIVVVRTFLNFFLERDLAELGDRA